MAHLSEDAALIEAFQSGEDLHAFTASRVFGVAPDEVSSEQRAKIKAMSYGLAYGLSAYGLGKQLSIDYGEAQGLMDEYFVRFGGVRDYLRDVVDEARRSGYTETVLGRRRYLPDLTSDNRQRREMAERMALNAPIQGSAADIVKVAMLRVDEAMTEAGLSSRMLLQVHDELVFEVAARRARGARGAGTRSDGPRRRPVRPARRPASGPAGPGRTRGTDGRPTDGGSPSARLCGEASTTPRLRLDYASTGNRSWARRGAGTAAPSCSAGTGRP